MSSVSSMLELREDTIDTRMYKKQCHILTVK